MLRSAITLTQVLGACHAPDGRPVAPVLGLLAEGDYDWPALEAEGRHAAHPYQLRRMRWVARGAAEVAAMYRLSPDPAWPAQLSVPEDGLYGFRDCAAWIVFGAMTEGYVAPLRPRAVFCADVLYRYVIQPISWFTPELRDLMARTFLGWRHARAVFATTPGTAADATSFAGVARERVMLLPTLVDPPSGKLPPRRPPGRSILWVTNGAPHKNQMRTLAALRRYWDELGGSYDVVICGAGTEDLRPGASEHEMARALVADAALAGRIRILGRVSDAAYLAALADSAFVLHNALTDNGTFVAFDAARAGRYFVSSDYPAMRYLAERYGVDTIWFPPRDVAATAAALARAEAAVHAGQTPHHALRADDPQERQRGYQTMLERVLA